MDEEKVRMLWKIFNQFDADQDGCVTEAEIAGSSSLPVPFPK